MSPRPVAALAVVAALTWAPGARAASLALTDAERAQARAVGERGAAEEGLGPEWTVTGGGGERVLVLTPFYRLALAARQAALRGKPLTQEDETRALREGRERLSFRVDLRGGREDFARAYRARLLVGGREVEPSFSQNERTAARQGDGTSFLARCVYAFPSSELTGSARVVLSIRDAGAREVARLAIDLSSMR